jgi:pSer/pThr/pTyr-binding forkhead associated (FHA) protein
MEVKLVVVGGKLAGKQIPITSHEFLIGRGPECHLRPQSSSVSRKHCAVLVDKGVAVIVDFASTNGTFVNGEQVEQRRELKDGDRLTIGILELDVQVSVSVVAKSKPKVHSVQEAAARTVAAASANEDDMVSSWLEAEDSDDKPAWQTSKKPTSGGDTAKGKSLHDTTAIPAPVTQVAPKPKDKTPPKPMGRFQTPPKAKTESSGDAANDVLKQFFSRKR